MAFAISIKTESSDTYAFDGTPNQEQIIEHIKTMLDEEFEYIASYDWDATYDIDFEMKL